MKTTNVTVAEGKAARDRLIAKARQQAALDPSVRDIAKMHRQWRPRPKPYTFEDMLPDTTQDE